MNYLHRLDMGHLGSLLISYWRLEVVIMSARPDRTIARRLFDGASFHADRIHLESIARTATGGVLRLPTRRFAGPSKKGA